MRLLLSLPNSFHVKHLRPDRRSSSSFSWAAAKDDEDGGGAGRDGGIWAVPSTQTLLHMQLYYPFFVT